MIEIIIRAIAAGLASVIGRGVYDHIKEKKVREVLRKKIKEAVRKKIENLSWLEKKAALSLSQSDSFTHSELGRLVKEKVNRDIPISDEELGKIVREELEGEDLEEAYNQAIQKENYEEAREIRKVLEGDG